MLIRLTRLGATMALIVGALSFGRLSEDFQELGPYGEIRFLALLLVVFMLALAALNARDRLSLGVGSVAWLAGLIALHAWVAASWAWSDKTDFGLTQLYELAVLAVSVIACVALFWRNPSAGVSLLFISFYMFATAFVLASIALSGGLSGELTSVGAGGIGAARMLGMGILAGAWLALRDGRLLWLVPLPLMLAAMLLSGSRAAVVALFPSLLALLACRRLIRSPRTVGHSGARVAGKLLVGAGLMATFFLTPYGMNILSGFVLSNLVGANQASVDGKPQLYLADRDIIFADAWAEFLDHPLGGLGLGSYVGPFGEHYPHNLFLSFAVDAGSLALIGSLTLCVFVFAHSPRGRGAAYPVALAGALFFLIASQFAGSYYDARFLWIFLALALLILDRARAQRSRMAANSGRMGTLLLEIRRVRPSAERASSK